MKLQKLELVRFGGVTGRLAAHENGFALPGVRRETLCAFVSFMLYGTAFPGAERWCSADAGRLAGALNLLTDDGKTYRIEQVIEPGKSPALRIRCLDTGKTYGASKTPGEIFFRVTADVFRADDYLGAEAGDPSLEVSAAAKQFSMQDTEEPEDDDEDDVPMPLLAPLDGKDAGRASGAAQILRRDAAVSDETAATVDPAQMQLLKEYEQLSARVAAADAHAAASAANTAANASAKRKLDANREKYADLEKEHKFWIGEIALRRFAGLKAAEQKLEEYRTKRSAYAEKATRNGFVPDRAYCDSLRSLTGTPDMRGMDAAAEAAADALYGENAAEAAAPLSGEERRQAAHMVAAVEDAGGRYAVADRYDAINRKTRVLTAAAVLLGFCFCAGAALTVLMFMIHWMYGAALAAVSAAALTGLGMALAARAGWQADRDALLESVGAKDGKDLKQILSSYDALADTLREEAGDIGPDTPEDTVESLLARWGVEGQDPATVLAAAEKVVNALDQYDEAIRKYEDYRTRTLEQTGGYDEDVLRRQSEAAPDALREAAATLSVQALQTKADALAREMKYLDAAADVLRRSQTASDADTDGADPVTDADRSRLAELKKQLAPSDDRARAMQMAADVLGDIAAGRS